MPASPTPAATLAASPVARDGAWSEAPAPGVLTAAAAGLIRPGMSRAVSQLVLRHLRRTDATMPSAKFTPAELRTRLAGHADLDDDGWELLLRDTEAGVRTTAAANRCCPDRLVLDLIQREREGQTLGSIARTRRDPAVVTAVLDRLTALPGAQKRGLHAVAAGVDVSLWTPDQARAALEALSRLLAAAGERRDRLRSRGKPVPSTEPAALDLLPALMRVSRFSAQEFLTWAGDAVTATAPRGPLERRNAATLAAQLYPVWFPPRPSVTASLSERAVAHLIVGGLTADGGPPTARDLRNGWPSQAHDHLLSADRYPYPDSVDGPGRRALMLSTAPPVGLAVAAATLQVAAATIADPDGLDRVLRESLGTALVALVRRYTDPMDDPTDRSTTGGSTTDENAAATAATGAAAVRLPAPAPLPDDVSDILRLDGTDLIAALRDVHPDTLAVTHPAGHSSTIGRVRVEAVNRAGLDPVAVAACAAHAEELPPGLVHQVLTASDLGRTAYAALPWRTRRAALVSREAREDMSTSLVPAALTSLLVSELLDLPWALLVESHQRVVEAAVGVVLTAHLTGASLPDPATPLPELARPAGHSAGNDTPDDTATRPEIPSRVIAFAALADTFPGTLGELLDTVAAATDTC